jgi:hypothetical protein
MRLDRPVYVTDVIPAADGAGGSFKVRQTIDDTESLDLENINAMTRLRGRFYIHKKVCADWYTPIVDFGSPMDGKNMTGLTVVFGGDKNSGASFGYRTRISPASAMKSAEGLNRGLDFRELEIRQYAYEDDFMNSYTVPLCERDINYAQFRGMSQGRGNFAIHEIVAEYTVTNKNRGVR